MYEIRWTLGSIIHVSIYKEKSVIEDEKMQIESNLTEKIRMFHIFK